MAAGRTRNIILKITGDERDAKRAAQSVREELRRLSREDIKARIDLDTRIIKRKIEEQKANLDVLANRDPSPEVDLKTAKAIRKLDRLNLQLDKLKLKNVVVDVDVKRGALERTAAVLGSIDRGSDKVFQGFGNFARSVPVLGQMLGSIIDGFVSFGNAVGSAVTKGVTAVAQFVPQLAGLAEPLGALVGFAANLVLSFGAIAVVGSTLAIALNAVLAAVVALAGALVALAASAAAALAGLGALAIGFGALLIPVALVGIGVMTRFLAVLKARQAQQQALAQSTQAAKTAEEAHTAALQQRKQAEQQLAEATVAGREAAAQAIRDERNAELGLLNTKNGVADARLQLALAKRDLRDFLKGSNVKGGLNGLLSQATDVHADPGQLQSILGRVSPGASGKKVDPLDLRQKLQAIRDAQLGVMNATNDVTNAEDRLAQTRSKEADFAQRGLRAYGPYRTALAAVARANQAIAKASEQKSAAENKYQQALAKLSPTEKTSLSNLDKFITGFQKFAKIVSDPVFKALNDVFSDLSKSGIDLSGALTKIGTAFGDVIRSFGAFLLEPASQKAFKVMADGAADLVRELGAKAFRSFAEIMREVAVTTIPHVLSGARRLSEWLDHIARQPGRIHTAVEFLVGQFKVWAGLAGAIGHLLLAAFPAAARSGGQLATWMTRIVNNWTKWIKANPREVEAFFNRAVKKTEGIVTWLAKATIWLGTNLPKAARIARTVMDPILGAVKSIYNVIKAIVDLLNGDFKSAADHFKKVLEHTPLGSVVKGFNDAKNGNLKGAAKDVIPLPGPIKKILFGAHGGLVPGVGSADTQPAMLMPGEFILRKGIVGALGIPFLNALNSGAVPAAPATGGGSGGGVHNYYVTVPSGGAPDPRSFIEAVHRIVQTKG